MSEHEALDELMELLVEDEMLRAMWHRIPGARDDAAAHKSDWLVLLAR
jgi:hypothetical protein